MTLHEPIDVPSSVSLVQKSTLASATSLAHRHIGRLATATIVVYGTLVLNIAMNPRAVAGWLDEFEPNPVVNAARQGVDRIVALSDGVGLAKISAVVRARAMAIIHGNANQGGG